MLKVLRMDVNEFNNYVNGLGGNINSESKSNITRLYEDGKLKAMYDSNKKALYCEN